MAQQMPMVKNRREARAGPGTMPKLKIVILSPEARVLSDLSTISLMNLYEAGVKKTGADG